MLAMLPGVVVQLSENINATQTTITVSDGGIFCERLGSGNFTYLTFSQGGNIEVMKVLSCNGETLTVMRGQSGTAAVAHPAQTCGEFHPVKEVIEDVVQAAVAANCDFTFDSDFFTVEENDEGECKDKVTFKGYSSGPGIVVEDGKIRFDGCELGGVTCLSGETRLHASFKCGDSCESGVVTADQLCAFLVDKIGESNSGGSNGGTTGPTYVDGAGISVTGNVIALQAIHDGFTKCGVTVNRYGQVTNISTSACGSGGTDLEWTGDQNNQSTWAQAIVVNGSVVGFTQAPAPGSANYINEIDEGNNSTVSLVPHGMSSASLGALPFTVSQGGTVRGIKPGCVMPCTYAGDDYVTATMAGNTLNIKHKLIQGLTNNNCWLEVDPAGHINRMQEIAYTWFANAGDAHNLTSVDNPDGTRTYTFTNMLPSGDYNVVAMCDNQPLVVVKGGTNFVVELNGCTSDVEVTVVGKCVAA